MDCMSILIALYSNQKLYTDTEKYIQVLERERERERRRERERDGERDSYTQKERKSEP